MKTSLRLFRVLCLAAIVCGAVFVSSAQRLELPAELSENSTLAEVIDWLDKTSFADARVGLNIRYSETVDPVSEVEISHHPEWTVFSKGFRLSEIDGCTLVLRNEDIKLLSYLTDYRDKRKGSLVNFRNASDEKKRYAGNLYIALDRLSYKKTKIPYRHAKKAEEEALLGVWRTEFKGKGDDIKVTKVKWRVPNVNIEFQYDLNLEITGAAKDGLNEYFNSDEVTFTFDDKAESDKFYAAFRQAIKLCRED